MNFINKNSVAKKRKKDEYSISQISQSLLDKYGIKMSLKTFKNLSSRFEGRTIITGSPVNSQKQRNTKLYNLSEISNITKNWSVD